MHVRILSAAKCINGTFYCKHWKTHCALYPGLHTPAFASLVSDWLSDRIASFPELLWLQFLITLQYPCLHTASNQKLEQELQKWGAMADVLWRRVKLPRVCERSECGSHQSLHFKLGNGLWRWRGGHKQNLSFQDTEWWLSTFLLYFTEGIKLPYSKMAHELDPRSHAPPSFPSLVCTWGNPGNEDKTSLASFPGSAQLSVSCLHVGRGRKQG